MTPKVKTYIIKNDLPSSSAPARFICRVSFVREQPLADPAAQAERDDAWTAFAHRLINTRKTA
jgi:hypothetical protein